MSVNNKDLLDLCRLNLMEENIKDSIAYDKDETMKAINWKKRHLITEIKRDQIPATDEVMKRHIEDNTEEGNDDKDK